MPQDLLPAYLAVGADDLKAKTVVERLKRHLESGLEAFNLDERTAGGDLEPQDLLLSLNTMPLGSGVRLVIIHDADKLGKPVSEAIIGYLADPNPGCVLCLVAERMAKTLRLYKAVAGLGAKAIIDCAPAKRWDLPRQVVKMARLRGMRMDEAAAQELVSRVGESTTMLDRQVATLAELCRGKGVVSTADVDHYVTRTAEVKPWDLLDALCARDAGRTLELYQLMQNPSEVALVAMVAGRLRELVCAKSLSQRGQASALAGELGKQAWQVKNHNRWAARFGAGELEAGLAACAACDRGLKTGSDPQTSFVRLVLCLCGAGA